MPQFFAAPGEEATHAFPDDFKLARLTNANLAAWIKGRNCQTRTHSLLAAWPASHKCPRWCCRCQTNRNRKGWVNGTPSEISDISPAMHSLSPRAFSFRGAWRGPATPRNKPLSQPCCLPVVNRVPRYLVPGGPFYCRHVPSTLHSTFTVPTFPFSGAPTRSTPDLARYLGTQCKRISACQAPSLTLCESRIIQ